MSNGLLVKSFGIEFDNVEFLDALYISTLWLQSVPLRKIFKYMMTFEGLGLDAKLVQATDALGFTNPHPYRKKQSLFY